MFSCRGEEGAFYNTSILEAHFKSSPPAMLCVMQTVRLRNQKADEPRKSLASMPSLTYFG